MTQVQGTALLFLATLLSVNSHCTQYGVCNDHQYVPAPPGHTPNCAKPGNTFCETVDHYPRQLIRHLIEKWGYDYNTLLNDESKDDFNGRYNHYQTPHSGYGYPLPVHFSIDSTPVVQPAITYGPINITTQAGYPDRRYKIEPYFLTNALQQPNRYQGTNHNARSQQWWKRYKRSDRRKRQAGGGTNLCRTRESYIMPRAALNTRGNWMYTVNLNEVGNRYTQLVRSEICTSSRCSGLCSLPNGYSSSCRQQYVQKRLVALEGNGERLYSDVFWFPHCCVCQITSNIL